MADGLQFPPLPRGRERLEELRQWNGEMLDTWRSRKDDYVRDYVMLGRWGKNPDQPVLNEWMLKLTYGPIEGQPDTRLPDPRFVFVLVNPVSEYLPSNAHWHCIECLRRIRQNAINHNFDPATLATDLESVVYELFGLAESLDDRILAALASVDPPQPTDSILFRADGQSAITRFVDQILEQRDLLDSLQLELRRNARAHEQDTQP